ncbi:MAG: rod shape-determining protein RodA [Bacteroidota bacterium]
MNKPWYQRLDYIVIFAWASLVALGLTAIYSSTHGPASIYLLDTVQQNFTRQLQWVVLSVIAICVLLAIPSRVYQSGAYAAYGISLLMLIGALMFGREINGAKSWLPIGPFSLQVSEVAKVGTVLALAQLYTQQRNETNKLKSALIAAGLTLVPAALIVLQNDTGTALVFLALLPVILFWSGIPLPTVGLIVSPAVAGYLAIVYWPAAIVYTVLVAGLLGWAARSKIMGLLGLGLNGATVAVAVVALTKILQPHQAARIASFVDPEKYRLTSGFHIIQSRAAIGSGGLTGKGFMNGTQTQMAFVPEQSTDFIFSVIGEEFGFIGSISVLILFAFLIIRLISDGVSTRHPFPSMFAAGVTGIFFAHVLINIGMATGVMPVIGIPLPFMSYGGSALLANSLLIGVALNLHMRRDEFPRYG